MRPSEARTHGAGLLLAESLVGINHGLHSRAAAVVPLMLQEDNLSPTDLKVRIAYLLPRDIKPLQERLHTVKLSVCMACCLSRDASTICLPLRLGLTMWWDMCRTGLIVDMVLQQAGKALPSISIEEAFQGLQDLVCMCREQRHSTS